MKRPQSKGDQLPDPGFGGHLFYFTINDFSIKSDITYSAYYIRFTGTIVGMGDSDPAGWAESQWRSLKVPSLFV